MSESPRIEELRRRVQGDPASIAFAALAEEFRRAGRFKEAVETSRAGLRHHPTYVSARVTLGRSLVELQELEQAERELAFVLRSAPDNLAARRALGELCWQRLRFADALTHFKAALALAPRDTELPGIIASLERELESERASVAATVPVVATAQDDAAAAGDTVRMTSVAAEAAPAGAGKQLSGAAAIAALEKFYRAIVRARDAKPPAAPHVTGA
jgi:tetratricopeptide (TPR) repeat protein